MDTNLPAPPLSLPFPLSRSPEEGKVSIVTARSASRLDAGARRLSDVTKSIQRAGETGYGTTPNITATAYNQPTGRHRRPQY